MPRAVRAAAARRPRPRRRRRRQRVAAGGGQADAVARAGRGGDQPAPPVDAHRSSDKIDELFRGVPEADLAAIGLDLGRGQEGAQADQHPRRRQRRHVQRADLGRRAGRPASRHEHHHSAVAATTPAGQNPFMQQPGAAARAASAARRRWRRPAAVAVAAVVAAAAAAAARAWNAKRHEAATRGRTSSSCPSWLRDEVRRHGSISSASDRSQGPDQGLQDGRARSARAARRLARHRARRVRRRDGAVGIGQVHVHAHRRLPRPADERQLHPRRQGRVEDVEGRAGARAQPEDRVRVPGLQPADAHDGARQRRVAAALPASRTASRRASGTSARSRRSTRSGWARAITTCRISCRAVSSSASRSRAR